MKKKLRKIKLEETQETEKNETTFDNLFHAEEATMNNRSVQSSVPSTSSQSTEGPQNMTGKKSLSRI